MLEDTCTFCTSVLGNRILSLPVYFAFFIRHPHQFHSLNLIHVLCIHTIIKVLPPNSTDICKKVNASEKTIRCLYKDGNTLLFFALNFPFVCFGYSLISVKLIFLFNTP